VEIGLDSLEFSNTPEKKGSIYNAPPWLFLEDQEGWTSSLTGKQFGSVEGILYAQGTENIRLMSASGQEIPLDTETQFRIRMKVTAGDEAYVMLRTNQEDTLPSFDAEDEEHVRKIPLRGHDSFFTYTVTLPAYQPSPQSDATVRTQNASKVILLDQIGLVFPALAGNTPRHILIDCIDIALPAESASQT
jgi:hypothetical protein